jgi:LEA14-like dessication related protein
VEPGREAAFKLELPLSVRELEEKTDIAFREAEAVWRVDVRSRWTSSFEEAQEASASAEGRFPVISEPVFSIVSIKMKRAELINTRLKVALRVDNPNIFPVAFRSMSYELFGEGRSWADGVVENLVLVEGGGSAEAELSMTMNFIDMNRALLDRFIRLDKVSYRLKGEVVVGTGLDFLPEFRMKFDKAGVSSVSE